MDLQSVIAFWLDCLKTENATEQGFGITQSLRLQARSRALLFDGDADPFIFGQQSNGIRVDSEELKAITSQMTIRGEQLYYGYPLYTYIDNGKMQVAPLFILRLEFDQGRLVPAEPLVSLGSQAGRQLGLTQGEIVTLGTELAEIIRNAAPSRLDDVMLTLEREVKLPELGFDPLQLTRNDDRSRLPVGVFYNRAVIYTAEAGQYNVHLLRDLNNLRTRRDLTGTALSYLTDGVEETRYDQQTVPVLPFEYDPYQVRALQAISANKYTVVSGPPGTGKSQFIANLIVNLATNRQKILLVSHTSEAVKVVNRRIGDEFEHFMMRSGSKELRQSLTEQVIAGNERLRANEVTADPGVLKARIETCWNEIKQLSGYEATTLTIVELLKDTQMKYESARRRRGLRAWAIRCWLTRKIRQMTAQLANRDSSQEVAAALTAAQREHATASRAYVHATYLRRMFKSGDYGKMMAYVEMITQRKTHYAELDPGERYSHATLSALNVWSCTLKSLGGTFPLVAGMFDYVIFDEASQIDLASAAPALYRAKKVVVVGDDQQLSHITNITKDVEVSIAMAHGVFGKEYYPAVISQRETSLFSSVKHALHSSEQRLQNHYRSNFAIANIFNQIFYEGKLVVMSPGGGLPGGIKAGVFWMDVKGMTIKSRTGSRYNEAEIQEVLKVLQRLVPPALENQLTIGIATPYTAQAERIRTCVSSMFGEGVTAAIRIHTAHQFQGSEVDILLISTVSAAAGEEGSMRWFQSNPQVLNVAISRAKQLLVVIGDKSHALASDTKLRDIATMIDNTDTDTVSLRPMNVFEKKLLDLLMQARVPGVDIQPQYLLDGFYTLDFALFAPNDVKLAIELDGHQHEIIGDIAIFEDDKRDSYLREQGWNVLRIPINELLRHPGQILAKVQKVIRVASELEP